MRRTVLVRYGAISEVARFTPAVSEPIPRGASVVVRTHRGLELGTLLEDAAPLSPADDPPPSDAPLLLRSATDDDAQRHAANHADCRLAYESWTRRLREWNLNLELLDLEWTLDRSKLVLYVLNDRDADCTRLALYAAASGEGIVEVQPVSTQGLVPLEPRGGCNSGGCGSCASETTAPVQGAYQEEQGTK